MCGSRSGETLCRLLITMAEETFDIRSQIDLGMQIMILRSEYVEGESSKGGCSRGKMKTTA